MKTFLLLLSLLTSFYTPSIGQTRKDSLYVFVGEKISVEHFYPKVDSNQIPMDRAFHAKYRIILNVFGNYSKDTIEFDAYDHYGIPAFSKYKYVLLYVSNYNGKLYHEKYQFADVYKTKNGRWASGYRTEDYGHEYNKSTAIKPKPIEFLQEVSYNVKGRTKDAIDGWYPSPYCEIKDDKAIVKWGNYIEELFELKKSGVLKARDIF